MATRSLGQLTLDLVARIGGFTGAMDQAARTFEKKMQRIRKDAEKLGRFAAIGVSVAAGALMAMVKSSINVADGSKKAAQAVGLTTEAYMGLSFAADISGVNAEGFASAMNRLNKNMGEAAKGTKTYSDYFKALGVSIKDTSGDMRAGDEVLKDIADRFEKMPDGVDKSAAALNLLGRSGAALIPFLNQGREGIEKLQRQAEAMGLVMSDKTGKQAEQFNDSLKVLGSVSTGMARQLTAELLPAFNQITTALITLSEEGHWASATADKLTKAFRWIASTAVGAAAAFDLVGKGIGDLAAIAYTVGKDAKWYEKILPFGGVKTVARNLNTIKDMAGNMFGDLEETAKRYADILNKIMTPGDDDSNADLIKNRADFLRGLEELTGSTADASEKLAEQWEDTRKTLQQKIDKDGLTDFQKALYDNEASALELKEKFSELPDAIRATAYALIDQVKAMEDNTETTRIMNEELEEQRKLQEETTAQKLALEESLTDKINKLTLSRYDYQVWLLNKEIEVMEQEAKAAEELGLDIAETYKQIAEYRRLALGALDIAPTEEAARELETFGEMIQGINEQMADVYSNVMTNGIIDYVKGVKTAKEAMRDFAEDTLEWMARIMLKWAMLKMLKAAGMSIPMAHTGGVIGRDALTQRSIPRFHGGYNSDEMLAILKKDEVVFTPGQMDALGKAINNNNRKGISVNAPITINGDMNNASAYALRSEIEQTVIRAIRSEIS